MLPERELAAITDWLRRFRRPLLVSHRRPDGDALGSLAGLALALPHLGITPAVALFEPLPPRYEMLRGNVAWRNWPTEADALAGNADALVMVDTCARSQLEPLADLLRDPPPTLVIDHHATSDPLATRAGDLRVFDVSAAATCVILAEWLEATHLPVEPALARALLVGIATDCGWFRFSNADARTLRAAARLADSGVSLAETYDALYQREPAAKLALIGRMLGGLRLLAEGALAILTLRQSDFAACGANASMTEDLVNEANRIGDTEATLLFTEEPDGLIRVNLRSKRWLDVAALAAQFGGGGHARAAGARVRGKWDEQVRRVIDAAVAALAARPGRD